MIKAKDLMIGDYINSSFGIAQVISIDKVGVTLINKDNGEFDIDFLDNDAWLQEIPLTPGILEKNGFTRDEIAGWRFRQYYDGLGLIYEIYWNNKGDDLEIVSNLAKIGGFDKKGIQFVHQLQHAIRLCGIEKEITL